MTTLNRKSKKPYPAKKWVVGIVLIILSVIVSIFIFMKKDEQKSENINPVTKNARSFTMEERMTYRERLEKIRYKVKAGPATPEFTTVFPQERIEKLVLLDLKKEELLKKHCDIEIEGELINAEIERMKSDYKRSGLLLEIANALDNKPEAMVEFWVRPILNDRYLRACALTDDEFNQAAKQKAKELLEEFKKPDFGLASPYVTIQKTTLKDDQLGAEDKDALSDLKKGQTTPVLESIHDFHAYKVTSLDGDTITLDMLSVPKPDFEDWMKQKNN